MNYKFKKLSFSLALMFSILINSGCQSTAAVINKEEPEKYLEVVQSDPTVDVEASLKESGQEYVCKEFYSGPGSSENRRACFVKAPDESKYKEIGVKLSQLPEAMLVDTGRNAIVVGKVFLYVVLSGGVKP